MLYVAYDTGGKMDIILQLIRAFFVGGALCMIAQILIDKTKLTPARILVSYVVAGVFLALWGFTSRWSILQGRELPCL